MVANPLSGPTSRLLSSAGLSFADHAPFPMATVEGAAHIVRHVNPAFCRLLDKTVEQIVGRPFPELLPKTDECERLLDRVFQTGNAETYTEEEYPDLQPVFWSYTMWPVWEQERLVGIMIQVAETAELHDKTLAMNEALVRGAVRQHELTEAAEGLNARLQAEIVARQEATRELSEKARLLDLSIDAIIVRDMEGRILYWNHGAEELYGWPRAAVLGKISHVLLQTTFPMPVEQMTAELHQNNRWTGELVHTKRDGQRVTVLARKSLDRDRQGNAVAVLEYMTDISELKRNQEAVRAAGERFRFLAESMQQKIFTAKPNGDVDYFNVQWMEFTGLTFEQIRDWGWRQFIHPDDAEENLRRWKQAVETGMVFQMENRFRRHDGIYRWHLSRAHPMRDAEGKITLWIGSNTDIDDMKSTAAALAVAQVQLADRAGHLEELVAERTAELTATNQQLEAFVYSIAHDLRAPLRSMQGFAALLVAEAGTALSVTGQDYAGRINKSAQFMDALLRDLLAFSRLSQQRVELTPVRLETVVESVLARLQKDIQDQHARVDGSGPWPVVLAHEPTLAQVLFNLVSNALKFVAPDGPPQIRLRAEERIEGSTDKPMNEPANTNPTTHSSIQPPPRAAWVRVWVEDNGPGIAPAHQDQIFRLFTRLDGEKHAGTGIGLAIVQKGIERMGGRVGVESAAGQGSRFWFELRSSPPDL